MTTTTISMLQETYHDSATGFDRAPDRYMTTGRETIDRERDQAHDVAEAYLGPGATPDEVVRLANTLFSYHCDTVALKYLDRKGKKGPPEIDLEKARWYLQMAAHVRGEGMEDPRSRRPEFVPYVRQKMNTEDGQKAMTKLLRTTTTKHNCWSCANNGQYDYCKVIEIGDDAATLRWIFNNIGESQNMPAHTADGCPSWEEMVIP